MPGTRTAWKTLKLKQSLPEMELKVVGTLEPKKFYEGDCPETWEYKLVDINTGVEQLVTKPYYYGWMNGQTIRLCLPNYVGMNQTLMLIQLALFYVAYLLKPLKDKKKRNLKQFALTV